MAIDFNKLNTGNTIDTITNPRDLFSALPHKESKYQYPRDVQSQVWKQWYEKRNDNNIVIKMNTGSGKTVVGLIMLKSSLNENKGPAVYIVPDNFLVEQVLNEAKSLGIRVTTDISSTAFTRGKEIFVCNIHKLVNGMSVFGVGERKIEIGTILIDDAHACIDSVESQYTIKISNTNIIYKKLLDIFLPSIKEQSEVKAKELEVSQPNTIALVPFWSWKNHLSEVTNILLENRDCNDLRFSLSLLKEHLTCCRCVISEKEIEVTPHNIPIERIASFEYAKRKIFMTATLVDDSILATHFNLGQEAISNVITPDTAGDIGDRMILIPQEVNPEITDDNLKEIYKALAEKVNVIIIVPSFYRAKYWEDVSDLVINNDNINEEIEKLKVTHIGLVILVNRYDGIDLPKDACRVLVIDNLPDSRRLIDQITESQLMGSSKVLNQKIQKIEQGMGRGVRSNDDYCVIFLMGKSLIQHLSSSEAIAKFSQATKAQFELSESLSEQLKDDSLQKIKEVVNYSLERDEGWISVSKSRLASLTYKQSDTNNFALSQREAYNLANINQYQKAASILNKAVLDIGENDKILKGYGKQILAEYINYTDEVEAQKVLLAAIGDNRNLLKPKEGIAYDRIKTVDEQANSLQSYLTQQYSQNSNQFIVDINAVLEDLIFRPETAPKFEEAIKKLAYFLGFEAQRPENEYNRGPDDLWSTGKQNYFIIECKNGVTNQTINKHDINQLNGSIAWFKKEYDFTSKYTPIMIHLGSVCEYGATPLEECVVMTSKNLETFKNNIHEFSLAIRDKFNQLDKIKELLTHYKLRDIDIVQNYTSTIKINNISS